ncbi:unnamed protein product [Ixodes pacificus]
MHFFLSYYYQLLLFVLHRPAQKLLSVSATDLRNIAACFATSFILCCLISMSGTQDQMS